MGKEINLSMAEIQPWKVAEKRGKKQNRIPPFAPSQNEIALYKKYLKLALENNLPRRALTLGATPELRDAAIELGFESVAVDISEQMMDKFSELMEYKNDTLDKRIIKSWLDMEFPDNYFGVIMADGSFINLAWREHNSKVAELCYRFLVDKGFMVLRQVVFGNSVGYTDIYKLIEDFRNNKIGWEDFFIELRFNIFKDKVYNPETFQYDSKKAFELIGNYYHDNTINEKEQAIINEFRNDIINTFYPKDEFNKMLEKIGFKYLEEFQDKPHLFFNYLFMMVYQK